MLRAAAMTSLFCLNSQLQQWRGIPVKVRNSSLDAALTLMQRKMQSSGMEGLIKTELICHISDSENSILAEKNLERRVLAQDLSCKLKAILLQKERGL